MSSATATSVPRRHGSRFSFTATTAPAPSLDKDCIFQHVMQKSDWLDGCAGQMRSSETRTAWSIAVFFRVLKNQAWPLQAMVNQELFVALCSCLCQRHSRGTTGVPSLERSMHVCHQSNLQCKVLGFAWPAARQQATNCAAPRGSGALLPTAEVVPIWLVACVCNHESSLWRRRIR